MKKGLTIIVFTLFYINPNISSIEVEKTQEHVIFDEKTDLIKSIGNVESGNNPDTINKREEARGFLQIRPGCVADANRIMGYKAFDTLDCYNIEKSIMIFTVIQNHYNPKWNKEIAAKLWNGGPHWYHKEGVKNYWVKVKRYLKKY